MSVRAEQANNWSKFPTSGQMIFECQSNFSEKALTFQDVFSFGLVTAPHGLVWNIGWRAQFSRLPTHFAVFCYILPAQYLRFVYFAKMSPFVEFASLVICT